MTIVMINHSHVDMINAMITNKATDNDISTAMSYYV